mgnify:CR=1 FL=1
MIFPLDKLPSAMQTVAKALPMYAGGILLLTVAAALLGITANVQTYAFFAGVSIAFAWLGDRETQMPGWLAPFGYWTFRGTLVFAIASGLVLAVGVVPSRLAAQGRAIR